MWLKLEISSYFKFSAFDVSADLTELGRTPVTVVCAGVKSILDIGLTLEYLVINASIYLRTKIREF